MKLIRKKRAFTLVEIMIVVLIIGILLAIAVPNFMSARDNSRTKSCINNLREIADAKDQWAMDTKASDAASPTSANLAPAYIKVMPTCPVGSKVYVIGNMTTAPTCPNGGTHILPETAAGGVN
jgi:prepilin-type N-terminal cleavage/methylation domain-containing protein